MWERLGPGRRWRLYLILSALALSAAAALSVSAGVPAFAAVAGIVAGIGVAGFWAPLPPPSLPPPARRDVAPQPFSALVRAVLPLVLPLLIFLVAGTVELGPLVQFAAGALAGLFAWAVVVRPEASGSAE